MRLKKSAAFAAFAVTVIAMALGINAPANAQGRHNGGNHGGFTRGGFNHGSFSHGGFNHGGFNHSGFNHGGFNHGGYFRGANAYRAHDWRPGWHPGPGYVRHSWAWYNSQPVYWRHAHPYYGTPGLNIFVHI